jgi:hypothetical protein
MAHPTEPAAPSETLIGVPRIARVLHVSHPTAMLYAAKAYFPTQAIDGRLYARLGDVLCFKEERRRRRTDVAQSA